MANLGRGKVRQAFAYIYSEYVSAAQSQLENQIGKFAITSTVPYPAASSCLSRSALHCLNVAWGHRLKADGKIRVAQASEPKQGAIDSVAWSKLVALATDGGVTLRAAGLLCGSAAIANEVCMAVGAPHHVTARVVVAPST